MLKTILRHYDIPLTSCMGKFKLFAFLIGLNYSTNYREKLINIIIYAEKSENYFFGERYKKLQFQYDFT